MFLGHRDDVADLLGAFDVFVLASHREGQPRAAMEAAASGLPVVATDIRGCRQVVDDGSTGMLVAAGDPDGLRVAILDLIGAPDRRAALGAAAVDKAQREFDEREVVRPGDGLLRRHRPPRQSLRPADRPIRLTRSATDVRSYRPADPFDAGLVSSAVVRIQSIVARRPSSSGTGSMFGKRCEQP